MQFLREYSSDSEEEEHGDENLKRPAEDPVPAPAKRPAHTSSVSPSPAPHTSSASSTQRLPPLDSRSFVTYSEEHSMNKHKKVSAFIYLPWLPNKHTQKALRKVSDLALSEFRSSVSNFEKRFTWNSNLTTKAVLHGKFGLTNKNAINALHVTLFPNLYGPAHLLPQVVRNLNRAVKSIEVPSELITKGSSKLDELTGSTKVRLTIQPQLTVYQSPKTGSVFVGVGITKFNSKQSGKQENLSDSAEATAGSEASAALSPEYNYLAELTGLANQQADLFKFDYNWKQFSSNPKIAHDASSREYHSSLLVCELKPMGKRLSPIELAQLRKALSEISTEHLENASLETDQMLLQTNDNLLQIKLI